MRKIALAILLAASTTAAQAADIVMQRSEGCSCCLKWAKHMEKHGHEVKVIDTADMAAVKDKAGIPAKHRSCHTAKVEGYVIEGHVPAADIERLLKQKPDAIGLAVAGMPMGSPGMEHGNHVQPYEVHLIGKDGSSSVWARHGS